MDLKSVTCVIVGGFLETMCDDKKENCTMVQRSIDWNLKEMSEINCCNN
jgi:hypothetical protein